MTKFAAKNRLLLNSNEAIQAHADRFFDLFVSATRARSEHLFRFKSELQLTFKYVFLIERFRQPPYSRHSGDPYLGWCVLTGSLKA